MKSYNENSIIKKLEWKYPVIQGMQPHNCYDKLWVWKLLTVDRDSNPFIRSVTVTMDRLLCFSLQNPLMHRVTVTLHSKNEKHTQNLKRLNIIYIIQSFLFFLYKANYKARTKISWDRLEQRFRTMKTNHT